jgi:hypothetical protein
VLSLEDRAARVESMLAALQEACVGDKPLPVERGPYCKVVSVTKKPAKTVVKIDVLTHFVHFLDLCTMHILTPDKDDKRLVIHVWCRSSGFFPLMLPRATLRGWLWCFCPFGDCNPPGLGRWRRCMLRKTAAGQRATQT